LLKQGTKTKSCDSKAISNIVRGKDTLLYIVNYNNSNGWMIISGDKRTPAILAFSEKGNFDTNKINPNVKSWILNTSDYIYVLKRDATLDTDSPDLKIWREQRKTLEVLKKERSSTRTKEGNDNMQLKLVATDIDFNDVEYDIPHLTKTHWAQGSPWNACVPFVNGKRCLTGCVAVAGAQMAYYLHYHIGKPVYAYCRGTCAGTPRNYDMQFVSLSSTIWDDMPLYINDIGSTDAVAALMGYIGKKAKMKWNISENGGSGARTSDLANYFSENNISCHFSFFYNDVVSESVERGIPVIVQASNTEGSAHCWIADGIYVTRAKTTYYYMWLPKGTDPPKFLNLSDTEKYVIKGPVYSSKSNTYYRMNWGWGYVDNGLYLFAKKGDWRWSAGGYTFNDTFRMLQGFK
jgi:hypothetical protein